MTDNEIIKAVECCIKNNCDLCPFCEMDIYSCENELLAKLMSIINRQQAEIEICSEVIERQDKEIDELNKFANERLDKFTERYDRNLKAEAIKEFAKKLKRKAYRFPCAIGTEYAVPIRAINETAGDEE